MTAFLTKTIQQTLVVALTAVVMTGVPCRAQQPRAPAPTDSSQQIVDHIVKSKIPVLIDFYAPWCGPCRLLAPILQEVEKLYKGKIEVMRVNIDVHRGIANYFRISSIPAVFLIKDKTAVKGIAGLRAKEDYVKAIEEVLAMKAPPPAEETSPPPASSQKTR